MDHKVVKRGNIIYYIADTSVVVKVGAQYISYNIYNTPSRSSLGDFKKKILASKPTQYASVIDMMDLAQKCKLVGSGARKPSWIGEAE